MIYYPSEGHMVDGKVSTDMHWRRDDMTENNYVRSSAAM